MLETPIVSHPCGPSLVLDPCRYIYTKDDEEALHRLHQLNGHFVLCGCAEYVDTRQDLFLAKRWEKARQQAGTDEKAAKKPLFGGTDAMGKQWDRFPATTSDLKFQVSERRGLVGIVPASIGAIVFDADMDLDEDARRLADLFGQEPLAVVASSKPTRGHIWYGLPTGHQEHNREYFLEGVRRGEIRASNGYILLWRPAELVAQLTKSWADDRPPLTPEQIEQTSKPINKPANKPSHPTTANSQHTNEIGRRPCDASWTAEVLAAQSEGGRHEALKSYLAHYRATTTDEDSGRTCFELLAPRFLGRQAGRRTLSLTSLQRTTKPNRPAEPLYKALPFRAHRNGHNAAHSTSTKVPAHQPAEAGTENQNLRAWLTPGSDTKTDVHDAARLLFHFADQLVIAYDPESTEATSNIYAITHNGRLSAGVERLQEMLNEVSDRYLMEINAADLSAPESRACCHAARAFRRAICLKRLAAVMPGTVATLRSKGMLPAALVVKDPSQIDADLTVLGCNNGVVDLHTGKLLPQSQARDCFVSATTGVDYISDAEHPAVNDIMPELPQNETQRWWYRYRGWALTHRPRRDMCAMITPPKCGKTVLAKADLAALGDYCDTIRSEALQVPGHWARGGTAHNGDLLKLGSPRRLLYAPDCLGNLSTRLLNQLSGGDRLQVRDVGEKVQGVEATAHLVIQGNPPDEGEHFLGLDDQSAEADAFRDRLRLYPLQEIPPDRQRPEYVDVAREDRLFREAWLARTVRQCQLMIDQQAPPDGCETMTQAVQNLAALEAPAWRREWLPHALVQTPGGTVNSLELYANYQAWHESEGDGKLQDRRVIFEAVRKFYPCGPGQKGVKMPANAEGKRRNAIVWEGWALAASG